MATLQDIITLVQRKLDDYNQTVFTPEFILPLVNAAQRTIATRFKSVGVDEVKSRTSNLSVPANTLYLDTTTTPALPTTLTVPDEIWEAKSSGSNADFFRVVGPQQLPNQAQSSTIGYWNWYNNKLWMLGATEARLLRIDYWMDLTEFPEPADPSDAVLIKGATNPIAFLCCSHIAESRGQYQAAERFAAAAQGEIEDLINIQTKMSQQQPDRRQPYRGRGRYQGYFRGAY